MIRDNNPIKRLASKRKSALIIDIFKGKITTAEVARQYDHTVSEVMAILKQAK